jgi:hypothetical protein
MCNAIEIFKYIASYIQIYRKIQGETKKLSKTNEVPEAATEQKKPIECEQVTIEVPKQVMAFLRFQTKQEDFESVEKLIEYDLLDNIRAEFEGKNGEQLTSIFELGPVFWEVLGDGRYKPEDAAPKIKVMLDRETIEYAKKHNIDINEAVKQHLERLKAENKN